MFKFLVVAFLFASAYGSVILKRPQAAMDWDRSGRIIGGENADITEAPYQVAMFYRLSDPYYYLICGGSIISPTVIACAAYCLYGSNPTKWIVRYGTTNWSTGGQGSFVNRIIVHPDYDYDTSDYDISLYILDSAINIDGVSVKVIPLPAQDATVADNTAALVTGWGSLFEGGYFLQNLQKVTIPIVNQQACIDAYSNSVTPRMICAGNLVSGGQDACFGDDGGPLVIDGVLIGITSWRTECARPGFPGIFTRVAALRNWIDSNMP